YWNVSESSDLVNWTIIGGVTLNSSGTGTFSDNQISGVPSRFYKLSNGTCCSQAIGFSRTVIPPGNVMIANQFDAAANTLDGLFKPNMVDGTSLPTGTVIDKWDGSQYLSYTWNGSIWSDGTATLNPGEGAFIENSGSSGFTVTFAGLVRQGNLVNPVQAGNYICSSILPKAGALATDLGYSPKFHYFVIL